MDLLKAEIARKRKAVEEASISSSNGGTTGSTTRKFVRQADILRLQDEERAAQQRLLDDERAAKRARQLAEQQCQQRQRLKAAGLPSLEANGNSNSNSNSDGRGGNGSVVRGGNKADLPSDSSLAVDDNKMAERMRHQLVIEADLQKLSEQEVKGRLREHCQPVTLFGESVIERVQRLVQVIVGLSEEEEDVDDEFRNVRAGKRAQDLQDEEAFDEEDAAEGKGNRKGKSKGRSSAAKSIGIGGQTANNHSSDAHSDDGSDDGSDDEDEHRASKSNKTINADSKDGASSGDRQHSTAAGADTLGGLLTSFSSTEGLSKEKAIYKYFRMLLKHWERDLDSRDEREKHTALGKQDTRTQKQCKDYVRPLFKMCKRGGLEPDILFALFEMVSFCEQGNFRAANDVYLRTAIGNAAWPIGLTMVGIHERSGRERISTAKVAHVMNNELQRKYLTSIKRLITYAQNKRSDVAPSMKVY